MKISDEMICPELREASKEKRTYGPFKNKLALKAYQHLLEKSFKNVCPEDLDCKKAEIKRADGTSMRICICGEKNRSAKPIPGVLWIHGGGYAVGAPEMDIPNARLLISACSCVFVAPDYTVSTKKPYPAALDDCVLALEWMRDNAEQLGIDTDRIIVGGASAGGGLTAALCLHERDRNGVKISFQIPLYAMLDDRMLTASMKDNDAPVWGCEPNRLAWKIYLSSLTDGEIPKYASPARETDYSGLPPAYSFVGSIEPFCDEVKNYFSALKDAGVPAELDIYEGCFHAFDMECADSETAKKAKAKLAASFAKACEK